jgi:hypothetical protein
MTEPDDGETDTDELEPDVKSVELETDDGERVVIAQQNTGVGTMVGQGEFPDPNSGPKSARQAADEQEELQRERPV